MMKLETWGNFTTYSFGSTGLERYIVEDYNPFRYRGYYYDVETGYYYLQSRYYNPNWGRFLNADGVAYLGTSGDLQAFNLFAYCSNDPIGYKDETGTFPLLGTLVGAVIGAVTGALAGAVSAVLSGGDVGAAVVSGAVTGAAIGLVMGSVVDPLVGGLICAGIAMANNAGNQVYNYTEEQKELGNYQINASEIAQNIDWGSVLVSGACTFFSATGCSYLVDYRLANVFVDVPSTMSNVFAKDVVMNGIITTSVNLGQVVGEPIIDAIRSAIVNP